MAQVAMVALVAATAMQAYSQYQAGQQQKAALQAQAVEQERQAGAVEAAGTDQARELEYQKNLTLGAQLGGAGAGGVTPGGSVLELMQETNRRAAINLANLQFNTASQAYALRRGATISRFIVAQAAQAGITGAATSLLTGGARAYFAGQVKNDPDNLRFAQI